MLFANPSKILFGSRLGDSLRPFRPITSLLIASVIACNSFAATVTVEWTGGDASQQFNVAKNLAGPGGTIIVPASPTGEPWTLESRFLLNVPGQTVIFEEDVTVISKAATPGLPLDEQPFNRRSEFLIRVAADDVSLIGEGTGATLAMRRDQFEDPTLYTPSTFRHVLQVTGAVGFLIENLSCNDAGGSGITVGRAFTGVNGEPPRAYSSGIVRNVVCDNNQRLGIAITSAIDVLVEDSVFSNTKGENPQAGLDIEPDGENDFMEQIVVRRCSFINNFRRDLQIGLFNFHEEVSGDPFDKEVDILIDSCMGSGSDIEGFFINGARSTTPNPDGSSGNLPIVGPTSGQIVIRNCMTRGSLDAGLVLQTRADAYPVIFENFIIENAALASNSPIALRGFIPGGLGNIQFNGTCQIIDCLDRPIIQVAEDTKSVFSFTGNPSLNNITGAIDVASPFPATIDLGDSLENVTIADNIFSNLVTNFGFEHWKFRWEDLGGCSISADAAVDERALQLSDSAVGVRQEVTTKLTPGGSFKLSAIAKGLGNNVAVFVTFQDSTGYTFECPGFFIDSADYLQSEVEFVAPSVFETAFVEIVRFSPGGDVLVDQVVLENL